MKQGPRGHVQDAVAGAKGKLKTKAGKKASHPGLQGDEKIGGKLKDNAGNAG
jgi:hypothetical protein